MINLMTIPLSNLYEEIMNLFDEPEKVISSESKVADKKEDEIKKIIDDVPKDLGNEPLIPKASDNPYSTQATNAPFQGEDADPEVSLEPTFQGRI